MGDENKRWTVEMRVERDISVTVEADSEAEARQKAQAWEIIGAEQPGDTINWKITNISKDF